MLIKGGQHGFFRHWVYDKTESKILDRILDGKILSTIGFAILCSFYFPPLVAILMGLGWLVGVAPSIGEEIGAVGGYKGNWPSDKYSWFGSKLLLWIEDIQIWGWISGFFRGAWLGLCLFLPTLLDDPNYWFLLAGASFPFCYWAGVSIQQFIEKDRIEKTGNVMADWHYGELIYGLVIGVPLCLMS